MIISPFMNSVKKNDFNLGGPMGKRLAIAVFFLLAAGSAMLWERKAPPSPIPELAVETATVRVKHGDTVVTALLEE